MDVALRCATEGGALALAAFRGPQPVRSKGRGNVVTDADVAVELHIKRILAGEFPAHAILSEETSATTDPDAEWLWVIDPIDGTKNYSMGVPFWCTNVALCHRGEPVLGVTYDAVHDERFRAQAGRGAWAGDLPIRPSAAPDVRSAIIGMDLGYDDLLGGSQIALMGRIFPGVQTIRILGSAALAFAYAACGRLDLFTHTNVMPWDVASGMAILREAGGVVRARDGGPMRITTSSFVAGGAAVVDDFLRRYGDGGVSGEQ